MKSQKLPLVVAVGVFGLSVGIGMIAKTVAPAAGQQAETFDFTRAASAVRGAKLYATSCASCHGTSGRGLPHQGPPLQESRFVLQHDDKGLVAFVRRGRTPFEADSVMNGSMPAKGGVSNFDDNDLQDIIAHIRTLQKPATVAMAR